MTQNSKTRIKPGELVRIKSSPDLEMFSNMVGTLICYLENTRLILVDFGKEIMDKEGLVITHRGDDVLTKPTGWWFFSYELIPVVEFKPFTDEEYEQLLV